MITVVCSTNRKEAVSQIIAERYLQLLKDYDKECQYINLENLPKDFTFTALYENSGKDKVFNQYRSMMKKSQKFVFIVPEYNGSFPGVLKAFIDGLEFPDSFSGKKAALVGVSSGVQGAGLALSHLTDIFHYCGTHVLAFKPKLMHIESNMIDNQLSKQYEKLIIRQIKDFVEF